MTTKEYDVLSSGEFHDKWFLDLKNNKFVDTITKKNQWRTLLYNFKRLHGKIFNEKPKLYYTKSHFPLEISQRAFDHLWRVCESYEMWCRN